MGQSAPEVDTPESEKLAAKIGAQRHNQRLEDGFQGAEVQAIAEAGRDRTAYLHGRGNADLAALEAKGMVAGPMGANAMGIARSTAATVGSGEKLAMKAQEQARRFQDNAYLGAIETGQDRQKNADLSRMSILQNDLSSEFSDAQATITQQNALMQSGGQLAGEIGAKVWDNVKNPNTSWWGGARTGGNVDMAGNGASWGTTGGSTGGLNSFSFTPTVRSTGPRR